MSPPVSVSMDQDVRSAAAVMVARDLRSLPVVDTDRGIVAMLDEHDIASAVVEAPVKRFETLQ
jgi:CBS domain-containing protein